MPSRAPPHPKSSGPPTRSAKTPTGPAVDTAYEHARMLATRFRLDPALGDPDARLAVIRSRWYGLDETV